MSGALFIRNRQTAARVDTRQLRRVVRALLAELGQTDFDLGLCLVDAEEITRLNETFLRHAGPTDVLAFDYAEPAPASAPARRGKAPRTPRAPRITHLPAIARSATADHAAPLHGEIFICLEVARIQSRRFRTTWQAELARYVVHGVLHLLGFDDRHPAARRTMKRQENRLLRHLTRSFEFAKLARR